MRRVRLIHWNAAEARDRAERLRAAGYAVEDDVPSGGGALAELRRDPPDAIVIDLSRIPSQGRDVGIAIRGYRALRHVPLVFVAGDRQKIAATRRLLPDATYTSWSAIRSSLRRAIERPPKEPVVPPSRLAAYADAPLAKKLGIKPNALVALVDAPPRFEGLVAPLPVGARLRRGGVPGADLTLWFTTSVSELTRRVRRIGSQAGEDGLWIIWPKKGSRRGGELSQAIVRQAGLAAGLVDYRVCRVDETWAGLRFARRRRSEIRPSATRRNAAGGPGSRGWRAGSRPRGTRARARR